MSSESGLTLKVEITNIDVVHLLQVFSKKAFDASKFEAGSYDGTILYNCEYLMSLDYKIFNINNSSVVLCAGYPPTIFVPEFELDLSASGDNSANTSCNSNGPNTIECANSSNANNQKPNRNSSGSNPRSITPTLENENSNVSGGDNFAGNGSDSDSSNHSFVGVTRSQRPRKQRTIYEHIFDLNKIRDFITRSRYARCRQRFIVPVIYFRGQYICRSATVSVRKETYSRYAYDYVTSGSGIETQQRTNSEESTDSESAASFSYEQVIKEDVALLNSLNIKSIVDLMVEQRKTKYLLTVSSSEKADPEFYENFNILVLPYPGCEFFKEFRDHNYIATNLHYNWDKSVNDANISIPKPGPAMDLDINWEEYRKWDLVEITQNYFKAILKYVQEENSGLLIHCISGWDRTPLFISLLRLSLWADGLIHKSLSALQITYLTLAYDWYLFGHQLPEREKQGEDILVFCFHILKYLASEEFSLGVHRKRTKTTSSSGSYGLTHKHEDEAEFKQEMYLASRDTTDDSYSNNSNSDVQIMDTLKVMTISNASTQVTTSNTTINNRSPNSKRTSTSPMAVPGGKSTRQRQESVSSNSSWNLVTETGSIDSVADGSFMRNHVARSSECGAESANSSNQSRRSNDSTGNITLDSSPSSQNSSGSRSNNVNSAVISHSVSPSNMLPTTTEDIETAGNGEKSLSSPKTIREIRLKDVRTIFGHAYSSALGDKWREGSGSFITKLF